ncbi:hypothetical protein [Hymenobacter lucidus]|uniref:YcxB family protein n=1 Tax=Hymenobacter lucidus TaxID=2880930 RepID=A0ABS8ASB9_9BACT|nr:hypothetical protein [Hymenobacter lucidus]MCB2408309.1 hypothetical protein [Hymenobacter lucidus]
MPTLSTSTLSAPIQVAPAAVSFADYQAIHQEQQRRRYPEQPASKSVASESWKMKAWRWVLVGAALFTVFSLVRPKQLVGWLILYAISTVLGLLHQWWKYRQAYRQLPDKQQATGFSAEPKGVTVTQAGRSRFFRWTDFYSIQQVPGWVLLYTSVEHCYYLKLSLVQPPATAADIERLLVAQDVAPTTELA